MNIDPETKQLQDSIQRSKVERAKALTSGQRLIESVRLFDQVRDRIKAGIRMKNPEWSATEVHQAFLDTLRLQRLRQEKDIYTIAGSIDDQGSTAHLQQGM